MPRSKTEWIGENDDSRPPQSVRLRVLRAYNGHCHISGEKIKTADKWDLDHIIPLEDGGENRESNLAPALKKHHQDKTSQENSSRAKLDQAAARHWGTKTPARAKLQSRGFAKTEKKYALHVLVARELEKEAR